MNERLPLPRREFSRADDIEDGYLVDVTQAAREHGIDLPVDFTRGAWNRCMVFTSADARAGLDPRESLRTALSRLARPSIARPPRLTTRSKCQAS